MSTKLYDDQLVEKLKDWSSKTSLHVYGPDDTRRLFEVIADGSNDEPIKLPIICLRRAGGYEILNMNKKPLTYDGMTLDATIEKSLQLNAIPINIPYQLDVYARYFEEADAYMRDIVFNIINHPTFEVDIPYNDAHIVHNTNIRLASNVENNSDIPERMIPGQFSRLTIDISIDDAYLWDARVRNNYLISVVDVQ